MSATTIRILFAIFLLAHGFMHAGLANVPLPQPGGIKTPFWPSWWRDNTDSTWPASKLGLPENVVRTAGWLLWLAALAAFVAAGLGILGVPGLKAVVAVTAGAGAVLGLLVLGLYWHLWYVAAVAINLAILLGVVLRWPVLQSSQ